MGRPSTRSGPFGTSVLGCLMICIGDVLVLQPVPYSPCHVALSTEAHIGCLAILGGGVLCLVGLAARPKAYALAGLALLFLPWFVDWLFSEFIRDWAIRTYLR